MKYTKICLKISAGLALIGAGASFLVNGAIKTFKKGEKGNEKNAAEEICKNRPGHACDGSCGDCLCDSDDAGSGKGVQ